MDRKGMKVAAKKAQRKHYWMIVAICLFASVFGVAYTSSTLSVSTKFRSAPRKRRIPRNPTTCMTYCRILP